MGSCTHKWLYRAIRFRSAAFSAAQPRPEPDAQRSRRSSPRAGTVHSRSRNNTDVSLPLQEVLARQCHHHRHRPKARIYELSSSAGARRSQSARGTRHAMAGDGSAAVTKGGLGSPRNFRNLKPGMARCELGQVQATIGTVGPSCLSHASASSRSTLSGMGAPVPVDEKPSAEASWHQKCALNRTDEAGPPGCWVPQGRPSPLPRSSPRTGAPSASSSIVSTRPKLVLM